MSVIFFFPSKLNFAHLISVEVGTDARSWELQQLCAHAYSRALVGLGPSITITCRIAYWLL